MTLPLWLQIITLVAPAAVAIFSAVWASKSARRAQQAESESARLRALEERVAEKKFEVYKPFVDAMGDMLTPTRTKNALADFENVIADFQNWVIVFGSDEVVDAFLRYRTSANGNPPMMVTFRLMADLLMAIRRDVAAPDTKLLGIHMIASRLNDIADHPELQENLSMPLSKLIEQEGWDAPFTFTTVPTIEPGNTAGRARQA
ncbi:hypothetical protein [Frigoribacterium sp. PhB116]|uniref:hypothetical protein n=1 Tax=Frigoribacterium sp. PhB116 TaxID=2485174 RepID=UPI00105BBB46|nr:hypothetical protein [Frigoribacterium sp. PhB116]TDT64442.1 hypothetical protein EDF20_1939 [Frigoribacterium sp. PhB116]